MIFDRWANNYIQARTSRSGYLIEVSINDPYEPNGAAIELSEAEVDALIAELQAAKAARKDVV